jgi:ubiquinone/menaquinone biosynthesis C-methylase UbiE
MLPPSTTYCFKHWTYTTSQDYQHSASFVPKLAGKVTQWLDLQKDDVVLDIGCGGTATEQCHSPLTPHADHFTDGILNLEFGKLVAQGNGAVHGIDSSAAMINAAKERCKDVPVCTFEGTYLHFLSSQCHNR